MNIYIYGTEKFKGEIKSILTKANLGINIELLHTLFAIKTKLESSPKDIFIIDERKIITTNFFTKRIKLFSPSDGIERELIEKYGVGDVCFNSINGMIGYINSRIKLEEKKVEDTCLPAMKEEANGVDITKLKNVYDEDDYEYKKDDVFSEEVILEPEIRDLTLLKSIDEIREDDIEDKMFEHLKV